MMDVAYKGSARRASGPARRPDAGDVRRRRGGDAAREGRQVEAARRRRREALAVPAGHADDAEAGVPGYVNASWGAIIVPAKTPKAIVDRLNARHRGDPERAGHEGAPGGLSAEVIANSPAEARRS